MGTCSRPLLQAAVLGPACGHPAPSAAVSAPAPSQGPETRIRQAHGLGCPPPRGSPGALAARRAASGPHRPPPAFFLRLRLWDTPEPSHSGPPSSEGWAQPGERWEERAPSQAQPPDVGLPSSCSLVAAEGPGVGWPPGSISSGERASLCVRQRPAPPRRVWALRSLDGSLRPGAPGQGPASGGGSLARTDDAGAARPDTAPGAGDQGEDCSPAWAAPPPRPQHSWRWVQSRLRRVSARRTASPAEVCVTHCTVTHVGELGGGQQPRRSHLSPRLPASHRCPEEVQAHRTSKGE